MMLYVWIKALHVASVLIFVGGLVAQTLAVASPQVGSGSLLKSVERWDRRVTTPAMLTTWLFGVIIAAKGGFVTSGWLIAKLAIVVALSGLHGVQSGRLRRSLNGQTAEVQDAQIKAPAFLLMALVMIAVLVVAKPF